MCALVLAKLRHAGQMPISCIVLITHVQTLCIGIGSNQWQRSTGDRPTMEVVQYEAHPFGVDGSVDDGGDDGGHGGAGVRC